MEEGDLPGGDDAEQCGWKQSPWWAEGGEEQERGGSAHEGEARGGALSRLGLELRKGRSAADLEEEVSVEEPEPEQEGARGEGARRNPRAEQQHHTGDARRRRCRKREGENRGRNKKRREGKSGSETKSNRGSQRRRSSSQPRPLIARY